MHYYPQLDIENMSMQEFAFWCMNAEWMHSQMLMIQQANAVATMAGGMSGKTK